MPPNRPCNICPCRIQCLIISGLCYIEEAGSAVGLVRAWIKANLHGAQPTHIVVGQLMCFFWSIQNFLSYPPPDYRRVYNYVAHCERHGLINIYDGPNGRKYIELLK